MVTIKYEIKSAESHVIRQVSSEFRKRTEAKEGMTKLSGFLIRVNPLGLTKVAEKDRILWMDLSTIINLKLLPENSEINDENAKKIEGQKFRLTA